MSKELFGTDGIRGVAGQYPLDEPTVYAFGVALGDDARKLAGGIAPEILIGADTRESSPWLAETVAGGLASRGVHLRYAGVITTPGVAWLTRNGPFAAGVMISASHNPYQDNGLKVFGHSGFKLPDSDEDAIEQEIFALAKRGVHPTRAAISAEDVLAREYLDYLASTVVTRFDGIHLVIDCGNGASSKLAPELFRRLGATVCAIAAEPDGRNINLGCGALHVEKLAERVVADGADFGVAFDGDADRAIFVAKGGRIVDGDGVLLAAARALRAAGQLKGDMVIATVMSNLGLERALEREGIRMIRTPVGDKYVLEEMERLGAVLGGEQSGHVIFRHFATTGDGLLTALQLFAIARKTGAGLEDLTAGFEVYPQKLVNVRVRQKKSLTEVPAVAQEIERAEREFAGAGRVLVRFSGTEPLARVMVEAPTQEQVEISTARIADAIRREMGE